MHIRICTVLLTVFVKYYRIVFIIVVIKCTLYSIYLLLGMLLAVAACFACRRPAFWECAVTIPTVRLAGLEPADHLVAAACNPAFACTTTMFGTETFALRGGGAVRYGGTVASSFHRRA